MSGSDVVLRRRPLGSATFARLEDWVGQGLCGSVEGDWFSDSGPRVRAAKEVCGRCPVRELCLAYAFTAAESAGIWGGLTTEERRAAPRRYLADRPATPRATGAPHPRAA